MDIMVDTPTTEPTQKNLDEQYQEFCSADESLNVLFNPEYDHTADRIAKVFYITTKSKDVHRITVEHTTQHVHWNGNVILSVCISQQFTPELSWNETLCKVKKSEKIAGDWSEIEIVIDGRLYKILNGNLDGYYHSKKQNSENTQRDYGPYPIKTKSTLAKYPNKVKKDFKELIFFFKDNTEKLVYPCYSIRTPAWDYESNEDMPHEMSSEQWLDIETNVIHCDKSGICEWLCCIPVHTIFGFLEAVLGIAFAPIFVFVLFPCMIYESCNKKKGENRLAKYKKTFSVTFDVNIALQKLRV